MRGWLSVAAAAAILATAPAAWALDAKTLLKLTAPAPAALQPFAAGETPRAVKFARAVIQLKPEPWAVVRVGTRVVDGTIYLPEDRLVSWQEGQVETDPSLLAGIFAEEMKAAGVPTDGSSESLFSQESAADLQVGVRVNEMNGRFCENCRLFGGGSWTGAVTMTARWEIYSSLERKVVATVETRGGYATDKQGLVGEPERLVYEAFRDSARRLVASPEFRRAVTTPVGGSAAPAAPAHQTLVLFGASRPVGVPQASKSVATVFAADGMGSGFLVSSDGHVLTNQHVVGGSKYVKLKWSDGSESLGEVVRADPRRDVALIKTEARGRAPLSLRTGAVQQGETVFAIGTPLEETLQNTMTKGIVSAMRDYQGQRFIQSDVGVTHGNSGGPLIDDKGAVIGLTVIGLHPDESRSLNLFIPIGEALQALALQPAS